VQIINMGNYVTQQLDFRKQLARRNSRVLCETLENWGRVQQPLLTYATGTPTHEHPNFYRKRSSKVTLAGAIQNARLANSSHRCRIK
jgi:hypothetical protein